MAERMRDLKVWNPAKLMISGWSKAKGNLLIIPSDSGKALKIVETFWPDKSPTGYVEMQYLILWWLIELFEQMWKMQDASHSNTHACVLSYLRPSEIQTKTVNLILLSVFLSFLYLRLEHTQDCPCECDINCCLASLVAG